MLCTPIYYIVLTVKRYLTTTNAARGSRIAEVATRTVGLFDLQYNIYIIANMLSIINNNKREKAIKH